MHLINEIEIPHNKVQPHCDPKGYIIYNPDTEEYIVEFYTDSGNTDIDMVLVHTHTFKNPFIDLDYEYYCLETKTYKNPEEEVAQKSFEEYYSK